MFENKIKDFNLTNSIFKNTITHNNSINSEIKNIYIINIFSTRHLN